MVAEKEPAPPDEKKEITLWNGFPTTFTAGIVQLNPLNILLIPK
jgi:hypothetical protein